jgi:YesN/AraC family two-component response regulator
MPKMNGIDMIEEILKINPDQAVVITTAHDEDEYLHKFAELGVTQVLQKPITFNSLLHTLKDIVS